MKDPINTAWAKPWCICLLGYSYTDLPMEPLFVLVASDHEFSNNVGHSTLTVQLYCLLQSDSLSAHYRLVEYKFLRQFFQAEGCWIGNSKGSTVTSSTLLVDIHKMKFNVEPVSLQICCCTFELHDEYKLSYTKTSEFFAPRLLSVSQ